jgi:uncharacterized repeat protein (TIGR01451 family)
MRLPARTHALAVAALLATLTIQACKDATTVSLLEIDATGVVFGQAYLDNNGNGLLDGGDLPLRSIPVVLTVAQGGQVVSKTSTDSIGFFALSDVPVGSYRLDIDKGSLGDSLEAYGGGTDLKIQRGDTTRIDFGVSFPVLSLESLFSAKVGSRVFTSGIVLNPRLPFGDGVVHFQSDTLYLRATGVARSNINVGDSVRLLGRLMVDQGRPVLDDVTPTILIASATLPVPVEMGSGEAANARGGRLDAALIRIRNAEISDTTTEGGLFRFRVDDGSGKVDVVFRPFLQLNNAAVRPDTVLRISQLTGLLTPVLGPDGSMRWRVVPRASADVLLEFKQADVGIKTTADRTAAIKGESFVFTVVVNNSGPLAASGVQVTDSVPRGLTFTSASTSRGSYDSATGLWALDSLKVGQADTLVLTAQVTTDLVGPGANQARISRIRNEVDPVPANNSASVGFTIDAKLSDLGLETSVDKVRVSKGDTIEITVVLDNAGPREALGVQVSDSVPFGLTFLQASTSRGTYDAPKGLWDVGLMPVDASDTLTIKATVTTDQVGGSSNRARVSRIQGGTDGNPTNNTATVNFTVETRLSDLALTASVDQPSVSRGDTIEFIIVMTNGGPRDAFGVQVTDSVPSGLTFRSATATRGSYDGFTRIWDVDQMPVGASDTLRIKAEVTTAAVFQSFNRARVTRIKDGGDPDQTNNVAIVTFSVVPQSQPVVGGGGRR